MKIRGDLPKGNLLKSYVHGPVVDEVLYEEDHTKNETLFFHQDHLMSTVALTDASGQVKESYAYDAFGNLTKSPLLPSTRFLYTGRELDFESNLYYSRNRYYDPKLGRFLTADPTGYQDGLNLYAYAQNNPLSYRDPLGLQSDPYWGGGRKKGKGGGLKGFFGVVLGIVAAVVAAPIIGAVAGFIGGAIGGAVGAAAGAVAGTSVGTAVGAAVGGLVTVAAAGAGAAIVSNAASNLVQGAPVFRGVGRSAITGAITGPINRIVSGITQAAGGIGQIARNVGSAIWNGVKGIGSAISNVVKGVVSGVKNIATTVLSGISGVKSRGLISLGPEVSLPDVLSARARITVSAPLVREVTFAGPFGLPYEAYGFDPREVSFVPSAGLSIQGANVDLGSTGRSGGIQFPIGPVTIRPLTVNEFGDLSGSARVNLWGFEAYGYQLSLGSAGFEVSGDN